MDELSTCVANQGFFYITDYGVSEEEHAQPAKAVMNFFDNASAEEKYNVICKQKAVRRGFTELECEHSTKSVVDGPSTDYVMKYSMGGYGNLFPNEVFESTWTKYYKTMEPIADEIAWLMLKAVDPTRAIIPVEHLFRFLYYPDVPPHRAYENEPLRIAAHYDVSIITMIHQTPCPNGFISLQCDIDGKFVDTPTITGSMLIQCGAIMALLTNGKAKVPRHQVLAPPLARMVGSNRTSSVFFVRPLPNFPVDLALARRCGMAPSVVGDKSTFGEWVGAVYTEIHGADGNANPNATS